MAQRPMSSILVTIWITVRIRESLPDHDPDPGSATLSTHTEQMSCKNHSAIILCWRSAEICALWFLVIGSIKFYITGQCCIRIIPRFDEDVSVFLDFLALTACVRLTL